MTKKRLGFYASMVGVSILIVIFFLGSNEKTSEVFHITLADPNLYNEDGVFKDSFEISAGIYQFRFVPNGDSPEILSISLTGSSFSFSEDFELKGIPHETGISVYYTWEYEGEKRIQLTDDQEIIITIDPHDNVLGPVSVDLLPLE